MIYYNYKLVVSTLFSPLRYGPPSSQRAGLTLQQGVHGEMYDVLFKNGYFRIKPNGHDLSRFDWLTYHKQDGTYYFLPNATTKKFFAATMLKDSDCHISESDLDMLKKFSLSQLRESPVKEMKLFKINGHSFKDYQVTALELMFTHRNFCLFLGPGTGKTAIAVAYLNNVQPKKVLVITPKKVIDQYATEIGKYINYMPDIEIMNFEKIITNEARLVSTHYDCVIIDESHRLKNYSSISSEIVRRMDVENMYLFTGTPQDKNRFEIISQIALFDKRFMPTKSLFIERYFEIDTYYRPTFEKRPDELTSMIRLATYGKETDSILKLPDKTSSLLSAKSHLFTKLLLKTSLLSTKRRTSLLCAIRQAK
jgi:Superfamily II DNA/RNA helicases, SNF2 family